MRKYKKEKTTTTHDVLIETKCDLCGVVAKYGDWSSSVYEISDAKVAVTIMQKEGSNYGHDGGEETLLIVDICPKCFKEVLIPFLREKGAKIRKEELDW